MSQVASGPDALPRLPPDGPFRAADYCGFFTLDEARASRNLLRQRGIRSEIAIRDAPGVPGEPVEEEYWLRVEATLMKQAAALLDHADAELSADEERTCGNCRKAVAAGESFCPHCGERFDV